MCEVCQNTGFRYDVRKGRCIRRVVVYAVSPISEDVRKCPTAGVKWGFREEENVQRMVIEHGDDVREGGAVCARFLRVDREKCDFGGCRGGQRRVTARAPL